MPTEVQFRETALTAETRDRLTRRKKAPAGTSSKMFGKKFAKSFLVFCLRLVVLAIPATMLFFCCKDLADPKSWVAHNLPLRITFYVVTIWTYGGLLFAGLFRTRMNYDLITVAFIFLFFNLTADLGIALAQSNRKTPLTPTVIIEALMWLLNCSWPNAIYANLFVQVVWSVVICAALISESMFNLEFPTPSKIRALTRSFPTTPKAADSSSSAPGCVDKPPSYSEASLIV